MNRSGISTAIRLTVSEMIVKPISLAPFSAASNGRIPSSIWREMFSSTTIASSTTKPDAMVSDIRVRLLIEKPMKYIAANAPTSDSGTEMLAITVARSEPRNRKITKVTSATASTSSNFTSDTEARMPAVRSVSTVTCTSAGSCASRSGSAALIASTVPMTLAPGWRCTSITPAGWPFIHEPSRTFSVDCTTFATSDSRIGAPLAKAMTRLL